MKKIFITIIVLLASIQLIFSQAFECQLITNANGYLEYQMRETTENLPPTVTTPITDITFTIRWLSSLGSQLDMFIVPCGASYNVFKALPAPATKDNYDYMKFGCDPIPVYPPNDWLLDWQTIAVIRISNPTSGSGDFGIAPDGWIVEALNFSYDSDGDEVPEAYLPDILGGATGHDFPNVFLGNKVWLGTISTNWGTASNWVDECEGNVLPTTSDIVYIPSGTPFSISTGTVNLSMKELIIAEGAIVSIPTTKLLTVSETTTVKADAQLIVLSGTNTTTTKGAFGTLNAEAGALRAPGTITINPDAQITCSGPTNLASPQQLKILASASGVGSFQDNGTINYGANGSALIETYLYNSGSGYYFHQVGPTVDNLSSGSGVSLGDFDISTMNTFAYEWNEPTQAWVNQYLESYAVNTGKGLMLTTDDGTTGEYAQEGSIINTNVTLNLTLSGDPTPESSTYGWNLKSNPYAMALDWDDVWEREHLILSAPNELNPTVYVLNNGTSNYVSYNAFTGSGTTRYIQVGQGFWLQYLTNPYSSPGNINITLQTSDRNHNTTNFLKDEDIFNQVTLSAEGNNSKDELIIAFRDYGTPEYDMFIDVDKWDSFFEEATEMWALSADQKRLTHDILPPLYQSGEVTVPMNFKCTSAGTYTINASEIESFEGNVEIYLEDVVAGGEWHDLVQNPSYVFNVTEPGIQNRFFVHFFNTTGLDDPGNPASISIYSWGQDAYIINHGQETVKEYIAYDLMGRELHRGTLPNNTVNKVTIGDVSAYYIVKVITKEGRIYTDKVYITK